MSVQKQLREKRQKMKNLHSDMEDILQRAEEEDRTMKPEEESEFDDLQERADDLKEDIQRLESHTDLTRELEKAEGESLSAEEMGDALDEAEKQAEDADDEVREVFQKYLLRGTNALTREELNKYESVREERAQIADDVTAGGALVAPQQFMEMLIEEIDDRVYMRELVDVIPVEDSDSLGMPSRETDLNDYDWTAEIEDVSEDEISFGERELQPHMLTKEVKASLKLLSSSAISIEDIVQDRLATVFGYTQENAWLTGDGANEPLGLFTADDSGISTSRDVQADNNTDSVTADGLINAKFALKEGYMDRAEWIFHRDAIKQIRKLTDDQGQYIWQPGLQAGQPDTILNVPYRMSEFAPNTFSADEYVGTIGDHENYKFAELMGLSIQFIDQLDARQNLVSWIARGMADGQPVLEEAFARVQLAST